MVRSPSRVRLCMTLLILNIAFIWGNSLLSADLSRAFSTWVKGLVSWLLPDGGAEGVGGGHHLLRKLAHFAEFTGLGLWLTWLAAMVRRLPWEHWIWPLLGGIAVACVDEIIQIFVPGRGPGLLDVGIDTLGVCLGIVLINLLKSIKTKFWRKIQ